MLKIIDKPRFTRDVAINTVLVQGTLRVTFQALLPDEQRALEQADEAAKAEPKDSQLLKAVVVDFETVPMPRGPEINAQDKDGLQRLLTLPGLANRITTAYYRALWEEQQGNSAASPAGQ